MTKITSESFYDVLDDSLHYPEIVTALGNLTGYERNDVLAHFDALLGEFEAKITEKVDKENEEVYMQHKREILEVLEGVGPLKDNVDSVIQMLTSETE